MIRSAHAEMLCTGIIEDRMQQDQTSPLLRSQRLISYDCGSYIELSFTSLGCAYSAYTLPAE
jgi:hypothetical protein